MAKRKNPQLVIDWQGFPWRIMGKPDMPAARKKFVQIRPLLAHHAGRDMLMPKRVAEGLVRKQYPKLSGEEVLSAMSGEKPVSRRNPSLLVISNPRKKGTPKKADPKAVETYRKFHMTDPGEIRTVWIPKGWPKNLVVIGSVDRFDVQDKRTGREITKRYSGTSIKVCMTSSRKEVFLLSTNGKKLGLKTGMAMRVDYTVPKNSGRRKWSAKWWHPHDSGPKLTMDRSGKAARIKGPGLKINVRGIIG